MNRAANGRLAEAISLRDVNISAILAPVHQRQQQAVFQRGLRPRPERCGRSAWHISWKVVGRTPVKRLKILSGLVFRSA